MIDRNHAAMPAKRYLVVSIAFIVYRLTTKVAVGSKAIAQIRGPIPVSLSARRMVYRHHLRLVLQLEDSEFLSTVHKHRYQ